MGTSDVVAFTSRVRAQRLDKAAERRRAERRRSEWPAASSGTEGMVPRVPVPPDVDQPVTVSPWLPPLQGPSDVVALFAGAGVGHVVARRPPPPTPHPLPFRFRTSHRRPPPTSSLLQSPRGQGRLPSPRPASTAHTL